MIYLAGPIDYADDGHAWRHTGWDGLDVYCPVCQHGGPTPAVTKDDIAEVLLRNRISLLQATYGLFVLDGLSVGTPIEAWWKFEWAPATVLLVQRPPVGYFVRHMVARGAQWFPSLEDARTWLMLALSPN